MPETNTSDLEAQFNEAAGIKPEATEQEPTEKKQPTDNSEKHTEVTTEETKPTHDWEKRYKDVQKSHDVKAAENKRLNESLEGIKSTLATLRSAMASAESVDEIHAALSAAEKASGGLTFEGLDARTASVLASPLNERFQSLEQKLLVMESRIESQQATAQLETEYPFLREHADIVKPILDELANEGQTSDDGDKMLVKAVLKGVEIARKLDEAENARKAAEASRQTPDSPERGRISQPAKSPQQEDVDNALLDHMFTLGSEKGKAFS